MYLLFIGLIVIAALLLCFVVMIQNSKGGGLASSFASSNQIMGVRKTTDFLEKATWCLAIAMAVLSILSAAFVTKTSVEEAPVNITLPVQATDAENVPTFPAAETQAPGE